MRQRLKCKRSLETRNLLRWDNIRFYRLPTNHSGFSCWPPLVAADLPCGLYDPMPRNNESDGVDLKIG
jgi:hypothetical protein